MSEPTPQQIVKSEIHSWEISIQTIRPRIEKLLPAWLTVDRFVEQALSAMRQNPTIMKCDKSSVFHSILGLAELGLDPSGAMGSGYLLPFKGVCTPCPGYRGLIDLACRSGEVKSIKAVNVYWGDEFDIEEGARQRLYHKPLQPKSRAEEKTMEGHQHVDNLRGAYMIATLGAGAKQFNYMTFTELERVRLRAPGGKSDKTPWAREDDPSGRGSRLKMYLKCPIRAGVKQLPISPVKALLLMRAEQLENENEKLVETLGQDGDPPPTQKGAEKLKAALKARKPGDPWPEHMSTDDYNDPPPEDAELIPDEPKKDT